MYHLGYSRSQLVRISCIFAFFHVALGENCKPYNNAIHANHLRREPYHNGKSSRRVCVTNSDECLQLVQKVATTSDKTIVLWVRTDVDSSPLSVQIPNHDTFEKFTRAEIDWNDVIGGCSVIEMDDRYVAAYNNHEETNNNDLLLQGMVKQQAVYIIEPTALDKDVVKNVIETLQDIEGTMSACAAAQKTNSEESHTSITDILSSRLDDILYNANQMLSTTIMGDEAREMIHDAVVLTKTSLHDTTKIVSITGSVADVYHQIIDYMGNALDGVVPTSGGVSGGLLSMDFGLLERIGSICDGMGTEESSGRCNDIVKAMGVKINNLLGVLDRMMIKVESETLANAHSRAGATDQTASNDGEDNELVRKTIKESLKLNTAVSVAILNETADGSKITLENNPVSLHTEWSGLVSAFLSMRVELANKLESAIDSISDGIEQLTTSGGETTTMANIDTAVEHLSSVMNAVQLDVRKSIRSLVASRKSFLLVVGAAVGSNFAWFNMTLLEKVSITSTMGVIDSAVEQLQMLLKRPFLPAHGSEITKSGTDTFNHLVSWLASILPFHGHQAMVSDDYHRAFDIIKDQALEQLKSLRISASRAAEGVAALMTSSAQMVQHNIKSKWRDIESQTIDTVLPLLYNWLECDQSEATNSIQEVCTKLKNSIDNAEYDKSFMGSYCSWNEEDEEFTAAAQTSTQNWEWVCSVLDTMYTLPHQVKGWVQTISTNQNDDYWT